MLAPSQSVFICFVQRSGSWLLAHLLTSTGVAGQPAEFFSHDDMRTFRAAWDVTTDGDYVARVKEEGTTPNGVFATKLAWNALDDLMFRLRRLTREYEASDLAVIETVFPNPRFLWIRREDVVAQAVSWAKASQTGQYAAHQPASGEATFDFDHIDGLMHLARVQTGAWRRWFALHNLAPCEITYEALVADPVGTTLGALGYLGLDAPRTSIGAPSDLVRQADAVNAEWVARYREIAGL